MRREKVVEECLKTWHAMLREAIKEVSINYIDGGAI